LENNERLEFLGDAVLELIATEFLFNKYPRKPEGELTAIRSALVRGKHLSKVAEQLKVFDLMFLSKGELQATGKAKGLTLANTLEAIIGAIYINSGISKAKSFINNNILKNIDEIMEEKLYIDAKSDFQEKVQEKYKETPSYKVQSETGPDHNKEFVCAVFVGKDLIEQGKGRSKNQAEQNAASKALKKLFGESIS